MQELGQVFTALDFDSDVRVLCEDGSFFFWKNARTHLWTDPDGYRWVFVFCEHYVDQVFDEDDLLEYSSVPRLYVQHPPIREDTPVKKKPSTEGHNCYCRKCSKTWEGGYGNDMQYCDDCYKDYYSQCTCDYCGEFKGNPDTRCKLCEDR